jgi:hypothetical protein
MYEQTKQYFTDIDEIMNTVVINNNYCQCNQINCRECIFYFERNIDRTIEFIYRCNSTNNYYYLLLADYMINHHIYTNKYYRSFFLRFVIRLFDDFNIYLLNDYKKNKTDDIIYNKYNSIFLKLKNHSNEMKLHFS